MEFVVGCVVIAVMAVFMWWGFWKSDDKDGHKHTFEWVGYGGCGWSVYECACGEKEIDA